MEQQIYNALCHNGGLVGSTGVLVDGARLSVPVAENPKSKKKVCVSSKLLKARDTGVHETRDPLEERTRSRYVYTFGHDEGRVAPRTVYEIGFGYTHLRVSQSPEDMGRQIWTTGQNVGNRSRGTTLMSIGKLQDRPCLRPS
jgi:hypothetical protein